MTGSSRCTGVRASPGFQLVALEHRLDLTGLKPSSPHFPKWHGQNVAVPLLLCDAPVLRHRLYDEFAAEVPIGIIVAPPLLPSR